MVNVKDILDLGYTKFEKWMLEVVKQYEILDLERQIEDDDLRETCEYIKALPQFKQYEMRETPCPVFVNLDDEGEDKEFLVENKRQVVKTITKLAHLPTIEQAAVMPDACSAGTICVGGVVAARNAIHPAFHSADVCCSMFLTEFANADPKEVLDAAFEVTHFGPTQRENPVPMSERFYDLIQSNPYTKDLLQIAIKDFATQGDGNHFLFVGTRKSSGNVCVVTHHGSRGFGARVFKKGMKIAQEFAKTIAPKGMDKSCAWIPMETQEGKDYWEALQIVREWTYANHKAIHDMIKVNLKLKQVDQFWNEHNFVFKRGELYYHAKGATPGWKDTYDLTLVPMNMAEPILITRGTEVDNGIGFLPHGAGRNMSRTMFNKLHPDPELPKGIDIRSYSGKLDTSELPQAYKNADEVKAQMLKYGLAEVVDEVLPYGSIMAGEIDKPWEKK